VFIPEVRAGALTIELLTTAHSEEHTTLEHGLTPADDLLALTRMQTYEGGPVKVHPRRVMASGTGARGCGTIAHASITGPVRHLPSAAGQQGPLRLRGTARLCCASC
jgi:hypothetical protein